MMALSKQYCLRERSDRVVLRGQAEKQEPQSRVRGTAALIFAHYLFFFKVFTSSPFRLGSLLLSLYQDKESKNRTLTSLIRSYIKTLKIEII
jgi:hypothetical protein